MDRYLQGRVRNYIEKWKPIIAIRDEQDYLEEMMMVGATITAYWFSNCRMFHESPCESCKYRFVCYTE